MEFLNSYIFATNYDALVKPLSVSSRYIICLSE